MPLTVVLDADGQVAAPVRDTLLRTAHAELYQARYSEGILEEVQRNLIAKRGLGDEAVRRTIDRLRAFPHKEIVETDPELIRTLTNDPTDRHVLAAAIHANGGGDRHRQRPPLPTDFARPVPDTGLDSRPVSERSLQ